MTEAQEKAVQEIRKIATEHFGSFALIARVPDDNGTGDSYRYSCSGPNSEVIGLLNILLEIKKLEFFKNFELDDDDLAENR